ncbi:signal transduction histidine kinase [Rubricella aquisinus]|uniref:histidine kinase n=1 Tax=Rubricella aquisinus TaxID=2028108 RepID=A0A840X5I9_9RHOB|nr:HAMP domain-containing sensor histidine kinase [Rubricella aquisinus]MBB5517056.1 signal transduction histidine kinase [Rubricella aquisinus]
MRFNSLSGRLLLLTVIFVMIAEVLIFVPSIARFRADYLQERLERAQIASLALLATPNDMVAPQLEAELLDNADVMNIVLRRNAVRELVLAAPMPRPVDATYDLRTATPFELIMDAMDTLLRTEEREIRVIGQPVRGGGIDIEITLREWPLRMALIDYGLRILYLSLFISAVTATLLFIAVRRFITKPIDRVVVHMTGFRDNPEDARHLIEPQSSVVELQEAETALRVMQERILAALREKERLAALGSAVAKISHDLRNMLTTAQLVADRLERSEDPAVKRSAPKLVGAISRAVNLCEATLAYGRSEEPEPEKRRVTLFTVAAEVMDAEGLADDVGIAFENKVDPAVLIDADPEQLHRILQNLIRNARQAFKAGHADARISVACEQTAETTAVIVSDTGPGIPNKALEHLFTPFQGSQRRGGTGLGLAIAAELVRGHGGALELVGSTSAGTTFRISFPRCDDLIAPSGEISPLQTG